MIMELSEEKKTLTLTAQSPEDWELCCKIYRLIDQHMVKDVDATTDNEETSKAATVQYRVRLDDK